MEVLKAQILGCGITDELIIFLWILAQEKSLTVYNFITTVVSCLSNLMPIYCYSMFSIKIYRMNFYAGFLDGAKNRLFSPDSLTASD